MNQPPLDRNGEQPGGDNVADANAAENVAAENRAAAENAAESAAGAADLIDRLFDDADAQQRDSIDADPEARQAIERMQLGLNVLRAAEAPELPLDFPARLRQKWQDEAGAGLTAPASSAAYAGASSRKPLRLGRHSLKLAAIAAVLLIAVLLGLLASNIGSPQVAWADVAQAMQRVTQFAAIVTTEDAIGDDGGRTLEFFYRAPDRWRLHDKTAGDGRVVFMTPGDAGVFRIKDKSWELRASRIQVPAVAAFTRRLNDSNMLDAIIAVLFKGAPPTKEPVPTTAHGTDDDMLVFDYSRDPARTWARVWVLKKSRLAVRIKVVEPTSNQVTWVNFDYSDPQPDGFFDRQQFDAATKTPYVDRPSQFYNLGRDTALGKPVSDDQVFRKYGVRAPKVLDVATTRDHEVLIKSDDPRNRSAYGGGLQSAFADDATDNWGNLYVRWLQQHGDGRDADNMFHYYLPVPPFKQGAGKQTLRVRYTAWNHHLGDKEQLGYDVILHEQEIDLPAPPPEAGLPKGWKQEPNATFFRHQALRTHYWSGRPPLEKLRAMDELLRTAPGSEQLLQSKMDALKELAGDEAAAAFFEREMKTEQLKQAYQSGMMGQALSHYLQMRLSPEHFVEIAQIVQRIHQARDARLAEVSGNRSRRESLEQQFAFDDLAYWLKALEALEPALAEPLPTATRVVRSRDGFAYILLEGGSDAAAIDVPESERSAWRFVCDLREQPASATARATAPASATAPAPGPATAPPSASAPAPGFAPAPAPRRLVILRAAGDAQAGANAATTTLRLRRSVRVKGERGEQVMSVARALEVTIALERRLGEQARGLHGVATRAELDRQFASFIPSAPEPAKVATFLEASSAANRSLVRQDDASAAALARAGLALADESPLENGSGNAALDAAMRGRDRFDLQVTLANALIGLGQIDEAAALLETLWKARPVDADATAWFHHHQTRRILSAQAAIIERLIESGQLDRAAAFTARVDAARPDFRLIPNLHRLEPLPWGTAGLQPRHRAADEWTAMDRAKYHLEQARRRTRSGE